MNILLNNYCNLKCPYCFANQVMEESIKEHMSIYDVRWLLDFTKRSNLSEVRLIGGEPTLHPDFHKILIECASKDFIKEMLVFTNGTFSEDINYLFKLVGANKNLRLLVNLNHPEDIGQEKYDKIINNVTDLAGHVGLTLGINLYKEGQDFQYIIDESLKLGLKRVRWSIVVPNTLEKANSNIQDYFQKMLPTIVDFLQNCAVNGLEPGVDCNNVPLCMMSDDVLRLIAMVSPNNLKKSYCNPVIDVKPDMTVIRCFGVNDEIVNIKDFKNHNELGRYFIDKIDKKFDNVPLFDECTNCASYQITKRSCACLAFRKSGEEIEQS